MPQLGAAGAGSSLPTIATVLEKLQSALQKREQDRSRHHSAHPHRGGLELLVGFYYILARLYTALLISSTLFCGLTTMSIVSCAHLAYAFTFRTWCRNAHGFLSRPQATALTL
jgi:hypothetical protein